ncbi:MAG TPA: hypothetical protein VGJ33_12555, partial [Candidatus Angelobacter sp.]
MRPVCVVVVTFLALLIAGCGGNSSTAPSPTPTPTPIPSPTPTPTPQQLAITSGNWDFAAASTSGTNFLIGGNVVQTGTSVTGAMHVINSTCITPNISVPITGDISGQTATITSDAVASQTINATLSGSATALTGTYTVTGTGCAGGDKGNIAGVLVPSISGTWKGTFVSNTVANPAVGVTASIVEGAPDPSGLFVITGTATYVGSPCFASGTATTGSAMGGRTTDVLLTNDDGSTVEFLGSLNNPAAPTQLVGTYTVTGGLCDG